MKYRVYSYRDFTKILKKNNYTQVRQKGDHTIWNNGKNTITISMSCNPMITRRLIKDYKLSL